MKTQLNDRALWFDGTNEVHPDKVAELLLNGVHPSSIVVTETSPDMVLYNNLSDDDEVIAVVKEGNLPLDMSWKIPVAYFNIDLVEFCQSRAVVLGKNYVVRAEEELKLIQSYDLEVVFKTLIYVVDTLKNKNQVWGVGRGSSCASLILHLIGVHEVDPVKYEIPASEFFHS